MDWLHKIADALDTPRAYFLEESRRGKGKIVPGDPWEKRLIEVRRSLEKQPPVGR